MSKFYKNMPFDMALEKAMRYCSYQERCQLDLTNRFIAWSVARQDWDKIIDYLMGEDFLNENRYVEAYVSGKFRIKKWGKNKIKMGLINKRIFNETLFNAVFESEISEEEYFNTIKELIQKKNLLIEENDRLKRRDKLYRFLIGKGYESELVSKELGLFN